ncbi:uncharacterized protein NEPG_02175 [Nematocida parisii ERTm1]|uniref:uncharacterized protein n=1 Tax=Nematocida parisii (strain ERTm1 / ATCC PRA-289) TaxID=881290 RepID=UPI000264B608|nr:uncharacterized protein NEPG_02175 [Nematocida parisii ERTm1]EIJ93219.1 hypothetical protein NEPG_02175 [Nematocida parisii ERTm1]|eukprot:XP_013060002.1 hypothetical protein NEPG_02175 [Nematocida parisii ERTm1]
MYFRYCLVLLYITNIKARMVWKDVKEFKKIVVGSYKDVDRMVSPQSSLHPTNLYINSKRGEIYNLSEFGCQVEMKYKMEVTASESGNNVYKCSKTTDKNGIRSLENNQPCSSDIYLKFYRCLIEMFPTVDGRATIYSEEKYSFLAFLNNIPEKKDRLRLLASLFLLSKGVGISLEIKTNEAKHDVLVLKTSRYSTENYFSTELKLGNRIYKNKMDENEPCLLDDKYYYTQTENIVDFYKEAKDKQLENISNPITDLKVTHTIGMSNALIQTYIFEYISSKEDMKAYLIETFNILKENVEAIERKEYLNSAETIAITVFKDIFCRIDKELLDIEAEIIKTIESTNNCVSEYVFIPFHRELSMPDILRTCYKNNELSLTGMASSSRNTSNPSMHFSPTNLEYLSGLEKLTIGTETSILTLLCCCFYNSTDMEYTLKRIENSPVELKQFFTKYRDLFDTEDLSVHYDWYKLFNTLTHKNSSNSSLKPQYCNGGLLSMLSIILDITNMFEVIKEELNELIKKVREEKNLSSKLMADTNNLVNKILALLSFNKKMEVSTDTDLRIGTLKNHESDIFGKLHISISTTPSIVRELTINFNFDKITAEYMDMSSNHDYLVKKCINSMCNPEMKCKLHPAATNLSEIFSFIIYKADKLKSTLCGKETLYSIISFNFALIKLKQFDLYYLFSCGRIIYTSDKKQIVKCISSVDYNNSDRNNYFIGRNVIVNIVGSMINFKTSAIDKVIYAIASDLGVDCFNDNIIMDEKVYSKLKPATRFVMPKLD